MRTLMQIYVKGSVEAVKLYQKAFQAEVLAVYPDDKGGYMHSEINAFGQIIAVSEQYDEMNVKNAFITEFASLMQISDNGMKDSPVIIKDYSGNTMQFCFDLGADHIEEIKKAYEVLKEGAEIKTPIGPCDYSECMFSLVDRFGVYWCVF